MNQNIIMFLIILLLMFLYYKIVKQSTFFSCHYMMRPNCIFIYKKKKNKIVIFPLQIKSYEKTECHDERRKLAREIYDNFIMKEMLSHTHVSGFLITFFYSLIFEFLHT